MIGARPPFILIDTGEGRPEYPVILKNILLEDFSSEDSNPLRLVMDVIITHRHADHFGGLPDVLNTLKDIHDSTITSPYIPPRIHIYPSEGQSSRPRKITEDAIEHLQSEFEEVVSNLPEGSYTPGPDGRPVHSLADNQILQGTGTELTILHTPGHTADSICLLLSDPACQTETKVLLSADTVLGQGTAVFTDLAAYISSLRHLLSLNPLNSTSEYALSEIYPGHGPVVPDGPALISQYIAHRLEREAQIVEILSSPSPNPANPPQWTIWSIVKVLYKDYPETLWLAASQGVGLHLRKLESDGRARLLGGQGVDELWSLNPNSTTEESRL